jgi:hypothetical protein
VKRSLQGLAASRYLALADPIVQWPRTPPFHGGNTGSNPVRVAPLHEEKRSISRFSILTHKYAETLLPWEKTIEDAVTSTTR